MVRSTATAAAANVSLLVRPSAYGELAAQIEDLLLASEAPVFRRGSRLVVPAERPVPGINGSETMTATLEPLSVEYLRQLMGEAAEFEAIDGRSKRRKPIAPPEHIARLILARVADWPFPEANGIITCPTIDETGRLIHLPGFDAETGLYLVPYPPLPTLPKKAPSRADAEAALVALNELLNGFPFIDDSSRAVALSSIITLVCRAAFPLAPLHAASAPTPGTGKSFLFDIAAAVASGRHCPVIAPGRGQEELEKRLGAVMLGGQPVVNLDNLDAPLCSSLLCQALERPRVQVRILGASQTIEVESRATWFATGTNLRIVDDLTRRCLIARLDTGLERPELREFEEDPLERIAADRGKYILAALTIVQAYATAGMPGILTPLASYRDWSDRIRSALVWIGAGDPCDSMPTLRENDPAWLERAAVYAAWPDLTTSYTAAELIRLTGPSEGNNSDGKLVFDTGDIELREALALVCNGARGLESATPGEVVRA